MTLNKVEATNNTGAGVGVFDGSSVTISNSKITTKNQTIATNNTLGGKGQKVVIENQSEIKSENTAIYLAANTNLSINNSKVVGKVPVHALLGTINLASTVLETTADAGAQKLSVEEAKKDNGPTSADGSAILIRANWYADRNEHEAGEEDLKLLLDSVTSDGEEGKIKVSVYNLKEANGPRAGTDFDQYTSVKNYLKGLGETVDAKFYTVNQSVEEDVQ